ncbi:hypothetical protein RZS08_48795, partial [Arthrospira platensis SPKY1]|nr:hypothetical protein [Arthrospira platensis SPKY1]
LDDVARCHSLGLEQHGVRERAVTHGRRGFAAWAVGVQLQPVEVRRALPHPLETARRHGRNAVIRLRKHVAMQADGRR